VNLVGTATVVSFDDSDAGQPLQDKYNAWTFTARSDPGTTIGDGIPVGTPGDILLTGGGTGTYDACQSGRGKLQRGPEAGLFDQPHQAQFQSLECEANRIYRVLYLLGQRFGVWPRPNRWHFRAGAPSELHL